MRRPYQRRRLVLSLALSTFTVTAPGGADAMAIRYDMASHVTLSPDDIDGVTAGQLFHFAFTIDADTPEIDGSPGEYLCGAAE